MYKRIAVLFFSPCGETKKAAGIIAGVLSERMKLPAELVPFTLPSERAEVKEFGPEDLVIAASPTYAGKLPNKILPDFKEKLKGNGAAAVACVTFGNRAYDDSLAELVSVLYRGGFQICAAAAVNTEHAMAHIGSMDEEAIKAFAEKIDVNSRNICVDGSADAPYYVPRQLNGEPAKFLKSVPLTDTGKCIDCKTCALGCPMGSVSFDRVSEITGICIKCHACINNCPVHAKSFNDEQLISHVEMLRANFSSPAENKFFL